jgi:hypothetical protein
MAKAGLFARAGARVGTTARRPRGTRPGPACRGAAWLRTERSRRRRACRYSSIVLRIRPTATPSIAKSMPPGVTRMVV